MATETNFQGFSATSAEKFNEENMETGVIYLVEDDTAAAGGSTGGGSANITIDQEVIEGSVNAVSGGAVYNAISNIDTQLTEIHEQIGDTELLLADLNMGALNEVEASLIDLNTGEGVE